MVQQLVKHRTVTMTVTIPLRIRPTTREKWITTQESLSDALLTKGSRIIRFGGGKPVIVGNLMMDTTVTLSREQVREIVKAVDGIGNFVKNLVSKPGNPSEVYAIMSNIAVIRENLSGMPRMNSN